MKSAFDFDNVKTTEFGVGRDDRGQRAYYFVPTEKGIQSALREMALATWETIYSCDEGPAAYDPGEKYASVESVFIPTGNELCTALRDLHEAVNLPVDVSAISNPEGIFCYFARLTDRHGVRLTAVRRATQFKGVLKKRLIQLRTDTLKMVEDQVFKLDTDFDLLIDDENVHVLRPSGLEFVGQLQSAIREAVPGNVKAIRRDLPFVNFSTIEEYAIAHTRAARYLASIRSQKETKNIDKRKLKAQCRRTGVKFEDSNGTFSVEPEDVMGFLEVLDRRRYEVELVKDAPEQYRAPSRHRLGK